MTHNQYLYCSFFGEINSRSNFLPFAQIFSPQKEFKKAWYLNTYAYLQTWTLKTQAWVLLNFYNFCRISLNFAVSSIFRIPVFKWNCRCLKKFSLSNSRAMWWLKLKRWKRSQKNGPDYLQMKQQKIPQNQQ